MREGLDPAQPLCSVWGVLWVSREQGWDRWCNCGIGKSRLPEGGSEKSQMKAYQPWFCLEVSPLFHRMHMETA